MSKEGILSGGIAIMTNRNDISPHIKNGIIEIIYFKNQSDEDICGNIEQIYGNAIKDCKNKLILDIKNIDEYDKLCANEPAYYGLILADAKINEIIPDCSRLATAVKVDDDWKECCYSYKIEHRAEIFKKILEISKKCEKDSKYLESQIIDPKSLYLNINTIKMKDNIGKNIIIDTEIARYNDTIKNMIDKIGFQFAENLSNFQLYYNKARDRIKSEVPNYPDIKELFPYWYEHYYI